MKQGLNFHLAVELDINLEDVEKIEFCFSREKEAMPIKYETYPGTVDKKGGSDTILLVPFTKEETYYFEDIFYLDTRITLKNTEDQPETEIVTLRMKKTLFEEGD